MFWYIGWILAGFAVGYMIAIYQSRNRNGHENGTNDCRKYIGYKKGINDCRNCKYMKYVKWNGYIECENMLNCIADMPIACSKYQRIEDAENEG